MNSNKSPNTSPIVIHYYDQDVVNPCDVANSFATHFESVYTSDATQSLPLTTAHNLDVGCLAVGISEIFDKLNALNVTKGSGDDGLPLLFFKSCPFILSRILWIIFKLPLKTGKFPTRWKSSIFTPIFKSGDRSHISNYRPISVLNVMPKILDNIIAGKLSSLTKNLIINEQHGFVANRSTLTNLSLFHHHVSQEIGNGRQIDVIYTDFREAFDTVTHTLILNKLNSFGISGDMVC